MALMSRAEAQSPYLALTSSSAITLSVIAEAMPDLESAS